MKISAEWLPRGRNAAAEEAATVARIRILIGNRSATDMRAPGQLKLVDHTIAPAYPLAEALAFRWWALAYGRGRTTRLRFLRAGFALPDISITGIGNGSIEVRCEPFIYENPQVEFVTKAFESVTISNFENDMKGFVDCVLTHLREENVDETPLSSRWSKVMATLIDPEERAFCKAAGTLDVDPYTCGDDVAAFIDAASSKFEPDDLEEFLAGVRPETGRSAIDWLTQAEQTPGDWSLLPAIDDCRREVGFRRSAIPPWTTGYASARKVRRRLHLSDTEPVGGLAALASRLGNPLFHATERSTTGLRGVSHVQSGKPRAIVGGGVHPASLLFTVARTFGDAIHFGGPRRSPVTDQMGTYRQQLGRAFAAEFLAPVSSVLDMTKRGDRIEDIAANFGVSEYVVSHQIENRDNNLAV